MSTVTVGKQGVTAVTGPDRLSIRAVARVGVVPLGCVIGLVMLLAIGSLTWHTSPSYGHAARGQSSADSNGEAGSVNVGTIPVAASKGRPTITLPVSPTRIDIPKLKASAPIVKVSTSSDGELEIPQNPRTVGWWSPGARPGAKTGTAILAGHINYSGVSGALGQIGSLKPGDTFTVHGSINARQQKAVTFRVTGVRTYHKTHLPYQQIFSQQVLGRVALVTCGGPFDNATGNYLDNVVVFGVPESVA